jgi:hypothetical protein
MGVIGTDTVAEVDVRMNEDVAWRDEKGELWPKVLEQRHSCGHKTGRIMSMSKGRR